MMKIETARNIETLRNKVNDNLFTEDDCKGIVSISTLRKYNLIEYTLEETYREELTLEQLLEHINSMVGEDCYGMDGVEYIQENGKIFCTEKKWGYRFKAE